LIQADDTGPVEVVGITQVGESELVNEIANSETSAKNIS
jgi:50S ribosomal subunit-associated GTPase HflX